MTHVCSQIGKHGIEALAFAILSLLALNGDEIAILLTLTAERGRMAGLEKEKGRPYPTSLSGEPRLLQQK